MEQDTCRLFFIPQLSFPRFSLIRGNPFLQRQIVVILVHAGRARLRAAADEAAGTASRSSAGGSGIRTHNSKNRPVWVELREHAAFRLIRQVERRTEKREATGILIDRLIVRIKTFDIEGLIITSAGNLRDQDLNRIHFAFLDGNRKPLCQADAIGDVTKRSLANMEKLIGEFRKLEPAPEIFIFQHIPGACQDAFGRNYACGQTGWQYRKNLDHYNRALLKKSKELKFNIVPVYINIDTENNFPVRNEAVNEGNPAKIRRQSNGVHPAPPGYYQMGDTLYCRLKAWLAESGPKAK